MVPSKLKEAGKRGWFSQLSSHIINLINETVEPVPVAGRHPDFASVDMDVGLSNPMAMDIPANPQDNSTLPSTVDRTNPDVGVESAGTVLDPAANSSGAQRGGSVENLLGGATYAGATQVSQSSYIRRSASEMIAARNAAVANERRRLEQASANLQQRLHTKHLEQAAQVEATAGAVVSASLAETAVVNAPAIIEPPQGETVAAQIQPQLPSQPGERGREEIDRGGSNTGDSGGNAEGGSGRGGTNKVKKGPGRPPGSKNTGTSNSAPPPVVHTRNGKRSITVTSKAISAGVSITRNTAGNKRTYGEGPGADTVK